MYETISDVYYYRSYQQVQPTLFQEEPIPNFAETLGKVFSLAASSPRYLEKLHLVGAGFQNKEARINRLYMQVNSIDLEVIHDLIILNICYLGSSHNIPDTSFLCT